MLKHSAHPNVCQFSSNNPDRVTFPLTEPVVYLGAGSVVVQSGQTGEVLFGDGWSRLGGDQTVGVRRVSNHQDLKIKRVRQTDGVLLEHRWADR